MYYRLLLLLFVFTGSNHAAPCFLLVLVHFFSFLLASATLLIFMVDQETVALRRWLVFGNDGAEEGLQDDLLGSFWWAWN